MTITWYGQSCFKIDTREAVLAIDPFSKDIGLVPPRFHADIVLVTHGHFDHANTAAIPGNPMIFDGPGEYEAKGIAVRGIPTFHDSQRGIKRGPNTVFRIFTEGIAVAHLGDFGESSLREETLEALGAIDVLLVPVGGTYTVDADAAAEIVAKIEPRLVIPMHYHLPGLKVKLTPVEAFLKAAGAKDAERLEKLSLKRKDLPETETRVVVLVKT
ncbi:MAG: MBL fold metallo-hydrolase [Candidatus Sungbacteria bacterium]|uniref:MBL fold metallo-hydrolase n=1 Tax=Candidatus Sungiibacteriota bacterium TaxID=2750080 RepID=A0A932YXT3_9BACT|nr:MBL fold metallo-hydrolase [Candidatus Sungbacteria bacterium]